MLFIFAHMPKPDRIDILLNDNDALIAADWFELRKLQNKYPYSNLIAVLLAKKQMLESGEIDGKNIEKLIFQSNNAGAAFATLLNQKKKEASNIEVTKDEQKSEVEVIPNVEIEKQSAIAVSKAKEMDLNKFIRNDFTKWLLEKDASVEKKYPEENKVKDSSSDLSEGIVSESLAQIYSMQGHYKEAIEMYKKLSLKNPKKSAYFAEIIENLKKN